jgi:hypothetical protein
MRTGIANLPLHGGKAPRWLFERMKRLAREITIITVRDFGPDEVLKRLSDPYWFQALGCVLGFDWHSSGVTTTVCGAVKEGIRGLEGELGLFVAGGKGRVSRKTPSEIESVGRHLVVEPGELVQASRLSAKVDTSGVQDGYQLYHHAFFFTKEGLWAVVQQGMNEATRYARRYHWLGRGSLPLTETKSFVEDPHSAVCCDKKADVLNMVAKEGDEARGVCTRLSWERPEKLTRELKKLKEVKTLDMPRRHHTTLADIHPERLFKIFLATYERRPESFTNLIGMEGVGPKTIRALSLISELVYGVKSPVRDPVRFSFPYQVDRTTYDESVEFLRNTVSQARVGNTERLKALKRLKGFVKPR